MNLIFWQNCVSPHQLPYIKELYLDIRINKIYMIAPVWELSDRKKMGWTNDQNTDNVEIVIAPNDYEVQTLFNEFQKNSVHFFSGIRADKSVYSYFKASLDFNVKRGIITEPPFDYKTSLFLHKIRFLIFDYKYVSKIDYVFAMGDKAVSYYKFWSKIWKVFLFGYCVNPIKSPIKFENTRNINLVYVGSLIKLKNISLLIKTINRIPKDVDLKLDIIGDGPEFSNLKKMVNGFQLQNKISFLGKLAMEEVHNKLSEYDILVMPSKRDGWGAVINEGLQSGLFIISSDNCGAKTLIESSNRGIVFKNKDIKSLENALNYCVVNIKRIKSTKQERILWSKRISGSEFSKYFVDCLYYGDTVIPPWKK